MRIIKSIHGEDIKVSDCDYDFLSQFRWRKDANGYFKCTQSGIWLGEQINQKQIHWFSMKLNGLDYEEGKSVDHINRDPSNNTHRNLRFATRTAQALNRGIQKNNIAGVQGVIANHKRWAAQIGINGTSTHLGTYDTKEQAHDVYLRAKAKIEWYEPAWSEFTLKRCEDLEVIRKIRTSKYVGVYKVGNKWIAQLRIKGHNPYLGTYDTELEASEAYLKAKEELYVS